MRVYSLNAIKICSSYFHVRCAGEFEDDNLKFGVKIYHDLKKSDACECVGKFSGDDMLVEGIMTMRLISASSASIIVKVGKFDEDENLVLGHQYGRVSSDSFE